MNEKTERTQLRSDETEIDLLALLNALLKRWWLIVIAAVVLGAIAFVGAKVLITPTYRSWFTAYINSNVYRGDEDRVTNTELTTSRNLTTTFSTIISSRPVVEEAVRQSGVSESYLNQLGSIVSVSTVNNTEILRVNITVVNPQDAFKISQAMETVSAEYVSRIVSGTTLMVITPSAYSGRIYSPNYTRYAATGAILGAVLMALVLIIREFMDNRVKETDDLMKRYGYAVMGTIHDLTASSGHKYGSYSYGYGYGYGYGKRRERTDG